MRISIHDLNDDYYKPGEAAKLLGLKPAGVQTRLRLGKISYITTETGRRLIPRDEMIRLLEKQDRLDYTTQRYDAIYARVSTYKQKTRGDLKRQIDACKMYCVTQNPRDLTVFADVGSGLNDNRKQLLKLIREIKNDNIARIFITYKDRLTRFGYAYIKTICDTHGTSIITVSDEVLDKSTSEELAEDIIAIIHSFSGKLYGMRKHVMDETIRELS